MYDAELRTPIALVLCLLLAVYAFAVFGYVTAAIAAYFVDKDNAARSLNSPTGSV